MIYPHLDYHLLWLSLGLGFKRINAVKFES